MEPVVENAGPLTAIRGKLEAIPGVEQAIVEGQCVWLLRAVHVENSDVIEAAESLLRAEGWDSDGLQIEAVVRAKTRARVRFEGVERIEAPDMRVRVRVVLEWKGELIEGEAEGEKGLNIELRTAALAALDALEQVSERPVGARLAGVKQLRAFDAELMVVALYSPVPEFQKYLGTVLVGGDPLRAAALAVLHALNRVLGNFLVTR